MTGLGRFVFVAVKCQGYTGSTKTMGDTMKGLALSAVAIVSLSTTAFSMPLLNQASSMERPAAPVNARIICEESGVCYRPEGRRPVARWIYGDGAFYGPYDGPRYYGWPGRRYRWSFLSPWSFWP
jgi:hypothetical protein